MIIRVVCATNHQQVLVAKIVDDGQILPSRRHAFVSQHDSGATWTIRCAECRLYCKISDKNVATIADFVMQNPSLHVISEDSGAVISLTVLKGLVHRVKKMR